MRAEFEVLLNNGQVFHFDTCFDEYYLRSETREAADNLIYQLFKEAETNRTVRYLTSDLELVNFNFHGEGAVSRIKLKQIY